MDHDIIDHYLWSAATWLELTHDSKNKQTNKQTKKNQNTIQLKVQIFKQTITARWKIVTPNRWTKPI